MIGFCRQVSAVKRSSCCKQVLQRNMVLSHRHCKTVTVNTFYSGILSQSGI